MLGTAREPSNRLRGSTLAGLAIALLLAAAVPQTATAAEPGVFVGIDVRRSGPLSSPAVQLTGKVLSAGEALANEPVAVQVRTTGTRTWRTIRTIRSSAHGTVRLRRSMITRGKEFRLVLPARRTRPVSRMATVPVVNALTVTATSNPTPTAGDEVVLTGTGTPGLVGERVHLQLLVGAEWRSVSSSVVGADSTYTVRAVATIGGDQRYRALVREGPGRAQTISPVRDLTVYAWYRLARTAASTTTSDAAPLLPQREQIAGVPYLDGLGRALQQGDRASTSFDLHNRCLAFRTALGPTTDSDPGFYGAFRARADDDTLLDLQLDRGSAQTARSDIAGTSRLTLTSAAATGAGDPAWGDPEVLCAGL